MSGQSSPFLSRTVLFSAVFFSLFIYLLYQAMKLVAPLLTPLLWAAILALAMHPIQRRLVRRLNERRMLSATIMTAATFFLVIGPAVSLLCVLAAQAADLYSWSASVVQSGKLAEIWNRFSASFIDKLLAHPALSTVDLRGIAIKALGDVSSGLAGQVGGLLKNTFIFVIDLAIMMIALFFFFRDGEAYYNKVIDLLPFSARHKEAISAKIAETFSAVINGIFLVALMQGAMTAVGFFIFHIPFAIFWGFLAALLALLPVGGAALIWAPGALYLYFSGSPVSAVLLAVWGTLLVSLPDNFLKPLIIGKKAHISTFILFVALLGGIQAFGFLGILFGPVIVTLVTLFIKIYQEEFADQPL